MPLARITLDLQSDDAAAFDQLDFAKKKNVYHEHFRIKVIAVIAFGIICYLLSGGFEEDISSYKDIPRLLIFIGSTIVFAAIIFIIHVLPVLRRGLLKKERKLTKEYSGLWVLTAYQEALLVIYGSRREIIDWELIELAEVNEDCLYLKLSIGEHLLLPREKVLTGDYDLFVSVVQERIKNTPRTNIKSSDKPFADH